jgi:probable phosphoglycerate mutase
VERVIMARHGESEASAAGRVNGDPSRPVHLTERGRKEARRLGAGLAGVPIDLCAVTSFPRTRETADVALADRDVPRITVAELDDPQAGELEGCSIAEFRDWFMANGAGTPVPDGESRARTVTRYAAGLHALVSRPERTILVVAHGLTVTYTLLAARGDDLPLSLEGVQAGYATSFELDRAEVLRAADGLASWSAKQERTA